MSGQDAFGTQLERSDMGSSPTFAAIANVTNFGGPGYSRETYDTTAHDSANQHREFVGGLVDAGEVTLTVNFDPADHTTLIGDFEDTEARDYKLTFPDTSEIAFSAWLTGLSPAAPVDGKLTAEITLKITGKPTVTAAS